MAETEMMAGAEGIGAGTAPAQNGPTPAAPKKRILIVSQHFWPEAFRINDVAEGFVENGAEADVLCGLPNYPAGEWFDGYRYTGPRREEYKGIQVFRSGEVRRKGNTGLRIFLNYVSFPLFALFSLPRLRGRKYDAVFCYNTSPVLMQLPAIVYAKAHGLPLTTYVLDLWPDNLYSVLPVQNGVLRRIALGVSNWFYRRNTRLIAMTPTMAGRLQEVTAKAKRPPKITTLPQYCEDFYAEDVRDDALAKQYEGHFNILFAGNLSPAQDLENLVRAVKLAKQQPGCEDVRVLILGDGMSRAALEAEINAQNMADSFLFCGTIPPQDIPRWTAFADALFAGLAKSENLGMTIPGKIPSYLAAGRPLLVAMDGEGYAAAQSSGAALVSAAGDTGALARNIAALRHMPPTQRAAMGKKGRAYYKENFCRAKLLRQMQDFILG